MAKKNKGDKKAETGTSDAASDPTQATQSAQSSKRPAPTNTADEESPLAAGVLAFYYIYFAALHGALSQLMLSPVYGSMIAADQHSRILSTGLLFGFMIRPIFPQLRIPSLAAVLPVLAFYIPMIQKQVFRFSSQLGPSWGPATTEFFTFLPFVFLCAMCAAQELDAVKVFREQPSLFLVPAILAYFAIINAEPIVTEYLASLAAYSEYLSRVWVYIGTSAIGLSQSTPRLAVSALPAIYYTIMYNPHTQWSYTTNALSKDLAALDWSLLERKESVTGYISVLQNDKLGFRLLRCDHSLLGGEWQVNEKSLAEGVTGTEPVYAVFSMLEAVRLMETAKPRAGQEKALVVGLGIGTAPKAFLAHGIDTTIIELDPVVRDYAIKYFDLPTNHTAYIEDAVSWAKKRDVPMYDYIIHDVFTGGAEPLSLFTSDYFTRLRNLLNPEGAIAINYAGDVSLPPTKQVLHTIDKVFEGRCRIFRDLESDPENQEDLENFLNMVVYCMHPKSRTQSQRPVFRMPIEADFLGSLSRKEHLAPKPQNQLAFPTEAEMQAEKIKVLDVGQVNAFRREQLESAKRHWRIMRGVVPSEVWENW